MPGTSELVERLSDPTTEVLATVVEDFGGQAGLLFEHSEECSSAEVVAWAADSESLAVIRDLFNQISPNLMESRNWPTLVSLEKIFFGNPHTQHLLYVLPLQRDTIPSKGLLIMDPKPSAVSDLEDHRSFDAYNRQIALSLQNATALAEVQRRYDCLLNCTTDGTMMVDSNRHILAFNSTLEKMTGWNKEAVLGKFCYEVLQIQDAKGDDFCGDCCPLLGGVGLSISNEATLLSNQGQAFRVGTLCTPFFSPKGNLSYAILSFRDLDHLLEAESFRYNLLATISHKLQTPISIIKAYTGILSRSGAQMEEDTLKDKLSVIEEESDHLSDLVSKILYTSRLEAGNIKLNRREFYLDGTAERIATRLSARAGTCEIQVDFPRDFPPVLADPDKMSEVLSNLIENAIKFSPDQGTIRVEGHPSEDQVLVSVSDSGIGISEKDQPRIFERFYRSDNSATQSLPGTGLGLYICKSLIEAHGGQIWVKSEPGCGTAFTFALPQMKGAAS